MNKRQLIDATHRQCPDLTRAQVAAVASSMIDVIKSELTHGGSVMIVHFGVLKLRYRKPRTARNLRANTPVEVSGHNTVVFVPAPTFKAGLPEHQHNA